MKYTIDKIKPPVVLALIEQTAIEIRGLVKEDFNKKAALTRLSFFRNLIMNDPDIALRARIACDEIREKFNLVR